jgi:glycosyltransferase involved in cell wall biosynthesis
MIAYYFPPIGGSGALRPLKLAKYLPRYGWRPVILTPRNPDWYYARDLELLDDLPAGVEIVRAPMLRSAWIYRLLNPLRVKKVDGWIRRYLMHPDDQIGWIPFAVRSGRRLLDRLPIDAVYSTSSPLSCHLIAGRIRDKRPLPWIADFRDEWFENPDFDFPTPAHRRLHYRLEGHIVRTCDKVIAPAPEFCRLLAKHDPDPGKFETLPMGYDAEEIDALRRCRPLSGPDDRFVLAFAGMFYGSFRPTRLIEAVSGLIDQGRVDARSVAIRFVGANRPEDLGCPDRYGICEFTGFVSHRKALGYLIAADALLLLLSKDRGEHVIPSKTFEYLAIGKPILALVPENGDLAAIIRRCRAGLVADFENLSAIRSSFLELFQAWRQDRPVLDPDARRIAPYNQAGIARRFAELLDEMAPAAASPTLEQVPGACPAIDS